MQSSGHTPDGVREQLAPPADLQQKQHQLLGLLQTRAGVLSEVQELLFEQKDLPEKVSGLEKLAAHGFPVPKHRRYIPRGKTHTERSKIVTDFLQRLPENTSVAVRSAHPQESKFSGGAFTSYILQYKEWNDRKMSDRIQAVIPEMVSAARPEDSLQLRRDIRHGDITNYDPANMGIYLNEAVESAVQVTVVPLDNGSLSLRFLSGDFYNGKFLRTIEAASGERYEGDIKQLTWMASVDMKDMVDQIMRAQALFDQPQEMEIHIGKSGAFHFVQTKNAIPESTSNDAILDELFQKGVQAYMYKSGVGYSDERGSRTLLKVRRASKRDEVREVPALVIDEREWIRDLMDPWEEPGSLWLSALQDNPDMLDRLTQKYQELMKLAEEMPSYALIFRNMQFQSYADREDLPEEIRAFGIMRQQLSECASVQLRGESDHYSGLLSASHHTQFGSFGPQQIGISHDRGQVDLPFETGDQLTIMIRDGKVSIYTPKQSAAQEDKEWRHDRNEDVAYLEAYGE